MVPLGRPLPGPLLHCFNTPGVFCSARRFLPVLLPLLSPCFCQPDGWLPLVSCWQWAFCQRRSLKKAQNQNNPIMKNRMTALPVTLLAACSLAIATGCTDSSRQTSSAEDHGHDHGPGADHAHAEAPRLPHGGTPVQIGDHGFHLELVHDTTTGEMLAYVLDGHMEQPVSVPATTFELVAKAEGKEHRLAFSAVTDTPEASGTKVQVFSAPAAGLAGISEFEGTILEITLDGKTFSNVTFHYPEGSYHEH